ncbi:hypothetical protein SODALDRAFT_329291 [Sodiomyces alkalinus F11]|uniref:HPP transmembrane region domain-containing protein n=1 Tax=Sodiomyces alkalinus (strain CBS 110278 / VKM F-3762 / F11) TaxID=1314773 RepID=A0A3N2PKR1_SODAK|nr:hypothetical protein SODALDRAFT_329291 [Sodiomyces alkalinus F11]ROT35118.1 hypothetical protein SODALDRAFT_329291 [Sodiomyces alkalinus F11]
MSRWNPKTWNIDIDHYINPWLPPPPWQHLPTPVSRFFGYRREVPEKLGNIVLVFWAFVGVFCSIALIEVVSYNVPSFRQNGVPIIVASFGAAAVLEFYSIDAPLAQPRNAILGQVVSGVVGIVTCKLFLLSPHFDAVRWVAGAIACAAATSAMALTKTVHPPAGATALLAVVDDSIVDLGWFLLPVLLLGCALMLGTALVVNNIQRRFPVYWWTPEDLAAQGRRRWPWCGESGDEEAQGQVSKATCAVGGEEGRHRHAAARSGVWRTNSSSTGTYMDRELVIRPGVVTGPEDFYLTPEELLFLESLCKRI